MKYVQYFVRLMFLVIRLQLNRYIKYFCNSNYKHLYFYWQCFRQLHPFLSLKKQCQQIFVLK